MESDSWTEPSELREIATRLLRMADQLDRCRIDQTGNASKYIDNFRHELQNSDPKREQITAGIAESIYQDRQRRSRFLSTVPLTEPAWDMLLDLYFRTCRNEPVSVSNACVASGVPSATALRWIDVLIEGGLIRREADEVDRRRTWLKPTARCMEQMESYLSSMVLMRNAEHLTTC